MFSELLVDLILLLVALLLTLFPLLLLNLLRICLERLVELDFRYLSWTAALILDLIDENDDKLLYCCCSIAMSPPIASSLLQGLPKMVHSFKMKYQHQKKNRI